MALLKMLSSIDSVSAIVTGTKAMERILSRGGGPMLSPPPRLVSLERDPVDELAADVHIGVVPDAKAIRQRRDARARCHLRHVTGRDALEAAPLGHGVGPHRSDEPALV